MRLSEVDTALRKERGRRRTWRRLDVMPAAMARVGWRTTIAPSIIDRPSG